MKITENVHQIRIDFRVTEKVERYVYVYLITGEDCYLIDSGVSGASRIIGAYMKSIGRELKEIKGIFLTHAHPDHIGAAKELQDICGCRIYASYDTVAWVENIDLQYKERPIPNFYQLVGGSVRVDYKVADREIIKTEKNVELQMFHSKGHSLDSVSWYLKSEKVLFIGDAIPCANELPILVDYNASMQTIMAIRDQRDVVWYCPAWDLSYRKEELNLVCTQSQRMLSTMYETVKEMVEIKAVNEEKEIVACVAKRLNMQNHTKNPLFVKSVMACIEAL